MTTWIFSLLLGCELMAPVLQLLIRLCHHDGSSESAEVEGRRRQAPSWPFLASRYLSEVLITSDVISKSVLTLLYWDLNSVLGSLTLKKTLREQSQLSELGLSFIYLGEEALRSALTFRVG